MIKDGHPYCDLCGHRMLIVTENEDGEEIAFAFDEAREHYHDECWHEEFDRQWRADNPCKTECRTQPCERSGDCWYNPPLLRNAAYERYYAPRIKGRGRKKKVGDAIASTIAKPIKSVIPAKAGIQESQLELF